MVKLVTFFLGEEIFLLGACMWDLDLNFLLYILLLPDMYVSSCLGPTILWYTDRTVIY